MEMIKKGVVLAMGLSVALAVMNPGIVLGGNSVQGVDRPAPPAADQPAPPTSSQAVFSKEQLDQLLAPIALYPDPLLTQVLIAATYPLEVVQAARWSEEQAKKKLKPEQIQAEADKQPWDPSIKSLAAFPQVLDMMNNKLEWTQKLGDAVLAQQPDVMASVQRLRSEADAAGNLKSSEQIKVVKEAQTIYIEPATPQVIYVPQYNPTVIYGTWPYPAYPPVYYPPPPAYVYPGYNPYAAAIGFGLAVGITAAVWNNNWNNHCDYHGGSINKSTNINVSRGGGNTIGGGSRGGGGGKWEHNPAHRKGAEYRDAGSRQKYGGQLRSGGSTNDFRGRENMSGRDQMRNMERSNNFGGGNMGGANRAGTMDRPGSSGGANRAGTMDRSNAFQGMGQGSQTRQQFDRGQSSRAGMSGGSMGTGSRGGGGSMGGGSRGGGGSFGGGSRGGGGGSRGGGGGGGRGGRR